MTKLFALIFAAGVLAAPAPLLAQQKQDTMEKKESKKKAKKKSAKKKSADSKTAPAPGPK